MELRSRDRDTVAQIFARPSSGNVELVQVRSLLASLGAVQEPDGKLRVTLGP